MFLAVLALLWLPLCAVCIWLYNNDIWGPHFDLAMMEMRVRDVGTRHTPLLGLPGRLGRFPEIGSHPGPLAFYLLAPLYWVLGGSYWALRTATLALNASAILIALLLARRRAGMPAVFAVGAIIAIIEVGFGLPLLSEAWNPNLPVLWFFPFLLAVWSVLDGDVKLLSLAAALASLCAQTHIPYLGVCGLLSAFAFSVVLARWLRAVRKKQPSRELLRACLFALATAAVLWFPPVLDEILRERGNLTILFEYFGNPPEATVSLRGGVTVLLEHLDIGFLVQNAYKTPGVLAMPMGGTPLPARGAELVAVWVICAVLALRMPSRALKTLHATVAAALVVGLICISRIIGVPWIYVVFFAWSVAGLTVLAIVGTVGLRLRGMHAAHARSLGVVAAAAALLLTGVYAVRLSGSVSTAGSVIPALAKQIAALGRDAARAIHARKGAPDGIAGRYVVTWDDAFWTAAAGLGIFMELERRGVEVYAEEGYTLMVREHRVLNRRDATARLHYANGGWILDTAKVPGAVAIAYSDLRTPAQRKEYAGIQSQLQAQLTKAGRLDLVPKLDRLVTAVLVPGVDGFAAFSVSRLSEIGADGAVFVLPPEAISPGEAAATAAAQNR